MSRTIRSAFDRERVQSDSGNPEDSRVQQSEAAACDINKIMSRWQKTGVLEHVRQTEGTFGDFDIGGSYQDACNRVLDAEAQFLELPAGLRNQFNNDPAELLDYLAKPENQEEARAMGLLHPVTDQVTPPPANPVPTTPETPPKPEIPASDE